MQSVQPQVDALHKIELHNKALEEQNKQFEAQNKSLSSQLEKTLISVQKYEKMRTAQQSTINKLEMHARGMDVTISTLASFINNLIEEKHDLEIPGDVQRILTQYSHIENNKSKNFMNLFKKHETSPPKIINPNKLMVKSLSTGKISLNNDIILRTNNGHADKYFEENNQKNNNFFSNSHMDILKEKLNPDWSNGNVAIKVDGVIENSINNVALALNADKEFSTKPSPTLSIDSGIETPLSPRTSENHPLSNCGVAFTYNGTRELKNIRTLKNFSRNSSPDL